LFISAVELSPEFAFSRIDLSSNNSSDFTSTTDAVSATGSASTDGAASETGAFIFFY